MEVANSNMQLPINEIFSKRGLRNDSYKNDTVMEKLPQYTLSLKISIASVVFDSTNLPCSFLKIHKVSYTCSFIIKSV